MPITVLPVDSAFGEIYVILDEELAEYFRDLLHYPSLRWLGRLDPYGNTVIEVARCRELLEEVGAVLATDLRQRLPPPPAAVDLEGRNTPEDGHPFGWDGLEDFLRKLNELLEGSLTRSEPLLAIGD